MLTPTLFWPRERRDDLSTEYADDPPTARRAIAAEIFIVMRVESVLGGSSGGRVWRNRPDGTHVKGKEGGVECVVT